MTLILDLKVKVKVTISWPPLYPTTLVRKVFLQNAYLQRYSHPLIEMGHLEINASKFCVFQNYFIECSNFIEVLWYFGYFSFRYEYFVCWINLITESKLIKNIIIFTLCKIIPIQFIWKKFNKSQSQFLVEEE